MAKRTRTTASAPFQKIDVLSQLNTSLTLVMGAVKTHEEKLKDWKETVVEKFSKAVNDYTDVYGSFYVDEFKPPRRNPVCSDTRVQEINRAISRIQAMTPDEEGSVLLRHDDSVWNVINYGNCL